MQTDWRTPNVCTFLILPCQVSGLSKYIKKLTIIGFVTALMKIY